MPFPKPRVHRSLSRTHSGPARTLLLAGLIAASVASARPALATDALPAPPRSSAPT